jgi:intraflagellar transport protein 52
MIVFACPREMFSKPEFDAMSQYLEGGGKILILLSEGGEQK